LVGKPQIFPSPTAEPEAAKIKASREENSPLCITVFLLIFFPAADSRLFSQ
jgi:hypothetical protein